ncbi:MAG: dTMP kinase [Deltaproteobacteria bacterium]|nr:dTMP kinase [Deltaproteobacteria bacterium]MBW1816287.1 dTMP kinase [Deltaproteobacteria bacterium]MBW2284179.1 dTMP kinase [Deltaproteobacteria bacterium]
MFITLEGIEGCGKSTQASRLVVRLKATGIPALLTLEPGGTRVGQGIRKILLDARNRDLSPLAELLLYEADRAQHVAEVIGPALKRGAWVVCDRYFDATTVYQGVARGLDPELIGLLNERASDGARPDITLLLDCPVHVGLGRALSRNETSSEKGQDRFEREKTAFHEAVREGYLALAREEPGRFIVVDGAMSEDLLADRIFERLKPFLPGKGS